MLSRANGISFLRGDLHYGCASKITILVLQLRNEGDHNHLVKYLQSNSGEENFTF